jgi:hypothetical protein
MTAIRIGRWLLVVLAIVGLAFTASVVSAHGDDPTADDAPPYNGTADDWAAWMEAHMTEHMGPGSVEWMESHMGVTVDEMARDMADGDYDDHGGYGQGHC